MSMGGPESHSVPEWEKRAYTEADVHAKLFEPEMATRGFPARTSTQAEGEHFLEQRRLAVHRLKSRRERGYYDGLYLLGNSPIVLCELKRYHGLDSERELRRAVEQLKSYALSEDFAVPPPFLLLYCGKPERTRFFRRRVVVDAPALAVDPYEELSEIWSWDRVKDAHLRGSFAEEVVGRERLLEILLHHLDRLEDDLRAPVTHAVQLVSADQPPSLLTPFGSWLRENPAAMARMRTLYERKLAEVTRPDQRQVIEEMVTQAALNHLNKVFFLNLCEDRHLGGFYRILREFLPATRSETTPTTAAVFLTLLRRKIRDHTGGWRADEEAAYRALRGDLTADIRRHVIEQNNWWELIRVAFDLAEEHFPLVYRDDAYDYFQPNTDTLAELIYDLSTKSFQGLDNQSVGDIYQGLLSRGAAAVRPRAGASASRRRSGPSTRRAATSTTWSRVSTCAATRSFSTRAWDRATSSRASARRCSTVTPRRVTRGRRPTGRWSGGSSTARTSTPSRPRWPPSGCSCSTRARRASRPTSSSTTCCSTLPSGREPSSLRTNCSRPRAGSERRPSGL